MSWELPALPVVAEGADVIMFPWGAAEGLLTALDDVVTALNSDADVRPGMVDTLSDWSGQFRNDFDETYASIMGDAGYLAVDCGTNQGYVVADAEAVVDDQQAENRQAENRQADEDEAAVRRNEARLY